MLGQDGHPGGADFIGGVPVAGHPVTPNKAGVDLPLLHHKAGHVVTDEGAVDAGLLKLIGCQTGALQEGAGFITPGVKGDAPLLGQKQGAQAGAVPGGGQGAGVAVGEDAVSRLDQGQAVFRDGGAHGDVFLVNGPGRLAHGRLDGGDVGAGHGLGHRQHPVQHVAQIDRCGAGTVEVISVPAAGL